MGWLKALWYPVTHLLLSSSICRVNIKIFHLTFKGQNWIKLPNHSDFSDYYPVHREKVWLNATYRLAVSRRTIELLNFFVWLNMLIFSVFPLSTLCRYLSIKSICKTIQLGVHSHNAQNSQLNSSVWLRLLTLFGWIHRYFAVSSDLMSRVTLWLQSCS